MCIHPGALQDRRDPQGQQEPLAPQAPPDQEASWDLPVQGAPQGLQGPLEPQDLLGLPVPPALLEPQGQRAQQELPVLQAPQALPLLYK